MLPKKELFTDQVKLLVFCIFGKLLVSKSVGTATVCLSFCGFTEYFQVDRSIDGQIHRQTYIQTDRQKFIPFRRRFQPIQILRSSKLKKILVIIELN